MKYFCFIDAVPMQIAALLKKLTKIATNFRMDFEKYFSNKFLLTDSVT